MSESRTDFELLRDFIRKGDQWAFADIVRRHVTLVYATALRKTDDQGAAEEVAQNVFAALAKKAWRFGPDDSLTAWLYKTTLLEAKEWLRGEIRRRRRNQTAAELGTTMKTPDEQTTFRALIPMLDEALLSLREKERTALLLRFYESQSLRDVGMALGVTEDNARKRVSTALDKISIFFQRRGYKTATVAAVAALFEKTAVPASASAARLVVIAALANAPAVSSLTACLGPLMGFTKLQTAVVCAVLVMGPVAWRYHHFEREREAASLAATQLAANDAALRGLQTEIGNLRDTSMRLEKVRSDAAAAGARHAEVNEKFEAWKKQLRERLLAEDFRWSDDCPFVRIPKSVLPALNARRPISRPGVISELERELLALTPDERTRLEDALGRHFSAMDNLIQTHLYETNHTQRLRVPETAIDSKIFVLPALGEQAGSLNNTLEATFKNVLGAERWGLVQPLLNQSGTDTLRHYLNLDANLGQEFAVWISKQGDFLTETYGWADSSSTFTSPSSTILKAFLPGATAPYPTATYSSHNFDISPSPSSPQAVAENWLKTENLPQPVSQAILDWLQQQATSHFATKENP
jgi:RNA polymerase sigma factor (sigma-70 family)